MFVRVTCFLFCVRVIFVMVPLNLNLSTLFAKKDSLNLFSIHIGHLNKIYKTNVEFNLSTCYLFVQKQTNNLSETLMPWPQNLEYKTRLSMLTLRPKSFLIEVNNVRHKTNQICLRSVFVLRQ